MRISWKLAAEFSVVPTIAILLVIVLRGVAVAQLLAPQTGPASNQLPSALRNIGLDQNLGARVPLDLIFSDENNHQVRLNRYFSQRPVILALVYYQCPMLCTQVLNGLVSSMSVLSFNVGRDFDVLTVSFDPRETAKLAAAKKETYLRRYQRPGAADGWHFLVGQDPSIKALTAAVGFRYAFDLPSAQ